MTSIDGLIQKAPAEMRTKLMQHFQIAKEYEKNPETAAVAYYCLMYIAHESLKAGKEQKPFAAQMKRTYADDELIKSMATGQQVIEELVTVLTGETNEIENDEQKSADQLRILMRKYYTIGGLTDVLSVFGPVKDDFVALGKMSKSRAVSIFRELKSGAGLGGGSSSAAAAKPPENTTFGAGQPPNAYRPPSPPRTNLPPQKPPAPAATGGGNYGFYGASGYDQPSTELHAPHEIIAQAQKLCRYANSALEHEDISTAFKNCEQSILLIMTNELDEIILPEELKKYRTLYLKAEEAGQLTEQNRFSYSYCLVRSKVKDDIRSGLAILRSLYDETNKDDAKRDYLYYMAIGEARLGNYESSLKYLDAILHVQSKNHQASNLKHEVERRMNVEGAIGLGVTIGAGALIVGGLAAAAVAILKK
ncbi:unnamed protein product [Didymodactylos carnosus]|uniref:Mitochondrial fission 1 protein n=1 Tax=Didymodactylos carnosus TaxID=1234261 RepID=A0A813ZGL6_9BILA|nr:unnamed protein product [Didymodactylos carnosus]CAF0899125.1 unnamed protein product [Didymodactylos carnosus]CAF3562415.1 unnamed protein product [Didymodactylos carnosus]CAF3681884.1 unnamed protein product [Didymodactylos carnosus]